MKQFTAELGALKGAGPRGDRRLGRGPYGPEGGQRLGTEQAPRYSEQGLFTGSSMLGVGGYAGRRRGRQGG